jgi:hypothetical protein
MAVLGVVAPCSITEAYLTFRDIALMEAESTSETSPKFHQTTRRNIPKDMLRKVFSKTDDILQNSSVEDSHILHIVSKTPCVMPHNCIKEVWIQGFFFFFTRQGKIS